MESDISGLLNFPDLMICLVSVKIPEIQGCYKDTQYVDLRPKLTESHASNILHRIKNQNPTLSFQN